jgi:hypothetical protein
LQGLLRKGFWAERFWIWRRIVKRRVASASRDVSPCSSDPSIRSQTAEHAQPLPFKLKGPVRGAEENSAGAIRRRRYVRAVSEDSVLRGSPRGPEQQQVPQELLRLCHVPEGPRQHLCGAPGRDLLQAVLREGVWAQGLRVRRHDVLNARIPRDRFCEGVARRRATAS